MKNAYAHETRKLITSFLTFNYNFLLKIGNIMGGSMYITTTSKVCHDTDKIFQVIHTAEKQLN